jgi:RNA polymerase sigma-70 factor, ECF subfamily
MRPGRDQRDGGRCVGSTEAAISAIAALPLDEAEAIMLRVVMRLSDESAGLVLGVSAGAVRDAGIRGGCSVRGMRALAPADRPRSWSLHRYRARCPLRAEIFGME